MAMDLAALRSTLRALRKKRGLTQQQLADAVGVDHSYISTLEREHKAVNPTVGALEAMFAHLGVRLDYVLIGADVELPTDDDSRAVVDAVLRSLPRLTEQQKNTLRALLQSWHLDTDPPKEGA